jgi:hypothetical protein
MQRLHGRNWKESASTLEPTSTQMGRLGHRGMRALPIPNEAPPQTDELYFRWV